MANLPPQRGNFYDDLSYQEAYDQWAYDITQEMNTEAETPQEEQTFEEDDQGRITIDGTSIGYPLRYLDTDLSLIHI